MGFGKYYIEINRGFSIFSLWFLEKKQYMYIDRKNWIFLFSTTKISILDI